MSTLTTPEQEAAFHKLMAVDSLVYFFYNYTGEDMRHLRTKSTHFDCIWRSYIDGAGQDTYRLLWELWQTKFGWNTKRLLLEYAQQRYAQEVARRLGMVTEPRA